MSRKGLMEQDLSKLDVTKLHPLSPEVISRQATINIGKFYSLLNCLNRLYMVIAALEHDWILTYLVGDVCCSLNFCRSWWFGTILIATGTIGHVAHGKSTVVKAISGVQVINIFLLQFAMHFFVELCTAVNVMSYSISAV